MGTSAYQTYEWMVICGLMGSNGRLEKPFRSRISELIPGWSSGTRERGTGWCDWG